MDINALLQMLQQRFGGQNMFAGGSNSFNERGPQMSMGQSPMLPPTPLNPVQPGTQAQMMNSRGPTSGGNNIMQSIMQMMNQAGQGRQQGGMQQRYAGGIGR